MEKEKRKKKNVKKRVAITLACIVFFVGSVLLGLQIGAPQKRDKRKLEPHKQN